MMESLNLPVGAIVEYGDRLMRHVGGGRFVPHVPDPRDALRAETPLAKRFDTRGDGPLVGGFSCSS